MLSYFSSHSLPGRFKIPATPKIPKSSRLRPKSSYHSKRQRIVAAFQTVLQVKRRIWFVFFPLWSLIYFLTRYYLLIRKKRKCFLALKSMACKINTQAFFFHVFQTRHLYTPGKMHLLFLSKGDSEEGDRGSWGFQNWFIGGSIVDSVMLLLFYTDIRTRSFLPSTDSKPPLSSPALQWLSQLSATQKL